MAGRAALATLLIFLGGVWVALALTGGLPFSTVPGGGAAASVLERIDWPNVIAGFALSLMGSLMIQRGHKQRRR